ncbi:MAG: MBL fold metallo-hydrolase, partial [Promethearchaeota archaeon]
DPWFSRNEKSRPVIHRGADFVDDDAIILISHGHFDHLQDVPRILELKTAVKVYCSKVARNTIEYFIRKNHEDEPDQVSTIMDRVFTVEGGDKIELENTNVTIDVIKSTHAIFDLKSIFRALFNVETLRNFSSITRLAKRFPKGDVLAYDIHFDGEIRAVFYGSMSTRYKGIMKEHSNPDILFVPVAGRFNAAKICARMAGIINPRIVIPVHQDDFYPPITYWTPTSYLKEWCERQDPPIQYLELEPEKRVKIDI